MSYYRLVIHFIARFIDKKSDFRWNGFKKETMKWLISNKWLATSPVEETRSRKKCLLGLFLKHYKNRTRTVKNEITEITLSWTTRNQQSQLQQWEVCRRKTKRRNRHWCSSLVAVSCCSPHNDVIFINHSSANRDRLSLSNGGFSTFRDNHGTRMAFSVPPS